MENNKTRDENDDYKKSLREIATHHGKLIVSLHLDIQEPHGQQEKSLPFVRRLECFHLGPKHEQPKYVPGRATAQEA
jgi:hypothetical protein